MFNRGGRWEVSNYPTMTGRHLTDIISDVISYTTPGSLFFNVLENWIDIHGVVVYMLL